MLHPVHVSLTNVEYSKDKNSFQITVKVFKDDFRKIIFKNYDVVIDVKDSLWMNQERETIAKYLSEHLQSDAFRKNISTLNIVKKEIDDLSAWYYLEIPAKKFKKKFEISNSLMLDLYPDQTNLLIFSYKDEQTSEMMTQSQQTVDLEIGE